jgi:hypothetical protein
VAQTPFLDAQTSTERIFTSWIPAAVIGLDVLSSIIVPGADDDLPSTSTRSSGRGAGPRMRERQRRDDLAGIHDRPHADALLGAAIGLADDRVLRHVDETAGQVARVRRLQRRCRPDPCGRRASS